MMFVKQVVAALAVVIALAACSHIQPVQSGPTPQLSPDGWDPE